MPSKSKIRTKALGTPSASAEIKADAKVSADTCCDEEMISQNSLLFAVAEQNLNKVADCISKASNLHDTPLEGCTPLLLAVKLGNLEIVKMLLQHGASCCEVDENGTGLLHHAAVNGFVELVHCLVDGGAKLDQYNVAGCTPLYQAALHGHMDCVRAFLELGANIEARTRTGATPLYIASDRGNIKLVDFLLDAGADTNVKTELHMTALLVAAFNGHLDVVKSLLSHNVDIEQRGPCGGTALYVAAQEGREHIAEFLIRQGARVDAKCEGDLTPSLIAAMQGHHTLVRILLAARGDVQVRTGKGSTLAIMAARHGRTNVLKTLVEVGGPKVLEGHNTEGLSALGASKSGRHTETTNYIEGVMKAQREMDLNAWEASLPDILKELDPPCKKKVKAKSQQKSKPNKKGVCKDTGSASANSVDQRPSLEGSADTSAICAVEVSQLGQTVDATDGEGIDVSAVCGPWIQVGRKGAAKPMLAITDAVPESPPLLPKAQPGPIRSPLPTLPTPGPMTTMSIRRKGLEKPMLAIAPPESPALVPSPAPLVSPLAAPSTPGPVTPLSSVRSKASAETASPFGLRAVLPHWPSTPETWPHLEDNLAATFWSSLPPAVNFENTVVAPSLPEDTRPGIPVQGAPLTYFSGGPALSMTKHCPPVFVLPWMPHSFASNPLD